MADNSSSSSSSPSSSTTGEYESSFALLEAVESAIIAVGHMQSYRLGDRTVTYADLGQLRQLRQDLLAEVAQRQRTKPFVSESDLSQIFV
jgi:hypothetical protein